MTASRNWSVKTPQTWNIHWEAADVASLVIVEELVLSNKFLRHIRRFPMNIELTR